MNNRGFRKNLEIKPLIKQQIEENKIKYDRK